MSGTLSDPPRDPRPLTDAPGPPFVRTKARVTNLYATPWHLTDSGAGAGLAEFLGLGRLADYYRLSADQLPKVLLHEELDVATLGFRRWRPGGQAAGARVWLLRLASGQIVAAFSVDAGCALRETIDLLEDCYYGDVQIGDVSLMDQVHALAAKAGADGAAERTFLPERHQIVLDADSAPEDCDDLVQRLVYRADLPYRKEYSAIRYPAELNRRPGSLAAVGPYVSVICGQQGYVEDAVFASAVQAVAAAAQLRAIRQAAYADVARFRALEGMPSTTRDRRRVLEQMADQLGDLELELSYSVEASADLGLLVPSLRVESFHNALYDCMGMAAKAETTGRMLSRLAAAISAELTAIESIERRADDNRRLRYAVAVGFVSAVALPASLILAFLGLNASQVDSRLSMFSSHYLDMYLSVAGLLGVGAVLAVALWVQHRREARHHRAGAPKPRWTPASDESSG